MALYNLPKQEICKKKKIQLTLATFLNIPFPIPIPVQKIKLYMSLGANYQVTNASCVPLSVI